MKRYKVTILLINRDLVLGELDADGLDALAVNYDQGNIVTIKDFSKEREILIISCGAIIAIRAEEID